jgi:hypothetical protein
VYSKLLIISEDYPVCGLYMLSVSIYIDTDTSELGIQHLPMLYFPVCGGSFGRVYRIYGRTTLLFGARCSESMVGWGGFVQWSWWREGMRQVSLVVSKY